MVDGRMIGSRLRGTDFRLGVLRLAGFLVRRLGPSRIGGPEIEGIVESEVRIVISSEDK